MVVQFKNALALSPSPRLTTAFRFSNVALEITQVKEKNLYFNSKFDTSSSSCQFKLEEAGGVIGCHVMLAALSASGERDSREWGKKCERRCLKPAITPLF